MSTADESSLEQRALAAAAEARAETEAWAERRRQEYARRQAEEEWALKTDAAKRLEETLGYPSSPHDWEYVVESYMDIDGSNGTYICVRTTVFGVEIRQQVGYRKGIGNDTEQYVDWKLSLAEFGRMLEERRKQEPKG
jgi:hypothetical protein